MERQTTALALRWLLVLCAWAAPTALQAQTGTLVGRVVDARTAEPLVSAQVFIAGGTGTLTNVEGRYIIRGVPAGVYTVQAQLIGYGTKAVTGVEVTGESPTVLDLVLETAAIEVEGITVSASAERGSTTSLLMERARATVVQDAIGADQISRSPDGDAGAALKRVPGLSVVDGKFAYVRGLGERYSSTTLNGAPLSSPVPDKKVIPLDIFPSGFLESIVTAKSYSPDQPGDYAGGLVQLTTKSFPSQRVFSVSVSGGWNSEATFGTGLGYAGGGLDALGLDDGARDLPAVVPRDRPLNTSSFATSDLYEIGRSFAGDWGPTARRDLPPNVGFGLSLGDDLDLGGERRLGFIVSGNYGSSVSLRDDVVERVFAAAGGDDPEVDYTGTITERSVTLGGMANATLQLAPTQQIKLSGVYNRIADDAARVLSGFNLDSNTNQRNTRLQYLGQSMLSGQLSGDHVVPGLDGLRFDWRLGASRATRYEPNTREVLYRQIDDGRYVFDTFVQSGSIFHQDMVDDGLNGAGTLRLPFRVSDRAAALTVGGSWDRREREAYTRRFRYLPAPGAVLDAEFRSQDPNDLFRPANIGPSGFQIQEATFRTDNYTAEEEIAGLFAMIDVAPFDWLQISGGARLESTLQRATPRDFFDTGQPPLPGADQEASDLLPAVNLTFALAEGMNLRASGSRTLARAQLRELAPFAFADYAGGFLVSGNPRLTRSRVENYDLRWEWFPEARSVVAMSAFYKRFDEPIEALVLPSSELIKSWVNADGATNYGIELEVRTGLGFIAPRLDNVALNANLTLIESDVQTGGLARIYIPNSGPVDLQVVDKERPLQGQSPYVVNLGLTWFEPLTGASASVLFNRFGRRIDTVGGQGTPDIYEEARSQFDLVLEAPVGRGWKAKVAASRLLGDEVRYTQGGDLLRGWNLGRTVSLGFSWSGR